MVAILVDEELLQSNSTCITSIIYKLEEISLPWPDPLYHFLRLRNPSSSSCVCHLPIACAQHMPTWMPIGVIKRHDLACIEMVMARYPKLCVPCTRWVDTLACNLSREASFGVNILKKYTDIEQRTSRPVYPRF